MIPGIIVLAVLNFVMDIIQENKRLRKEQIMTQLNGHLKGFPKNMDLDERTMLAIARMIAYVTAFSTPLSNVPPEMSRDLIKLDAKLVDTWLMGKDIDEA